MKYLPYLPPSCDVLAYHDHGGYGPRYGPRTLALPKQGVVRINNESKSGPKMGMGHSKGTSRVKCGVLAWFVRKYLPFIHAGGEA
jgi:hypothetical protein